MGNVTHPLKALIEERLGEPVERFIRDRRKPRKSLRDIAAEIAERTGVTVSYEAVRLWTMAAEAATDKELADDVAAGAP